MQALKNGTSTARDHSYQVSAQRADQLLVLESLAKKWVDDEVFAERAKKLIDSHNAEYNPSGDYWLSERIGAMNKTCFSLEKNISVLG